MTTLDSILRAFSRENVVFSPSIRPLLDQGILSQLALANQQAAIHNTTLTVEGLASKAAEVEGVDSPSQLSGQVLAEVSQILGQGEQTLTEECLASIANLVDGFMPPAQEVAEVTTRIASQPSASVLNDYLNSASSDLETSAQVLLERAQQANGQQINVHAGNLIQHTSGAIVQRSNGPYMLSTPSAQTTARTIVHQSSYDVNIADAHHQESRVSFHNHESLIQNLGQEATSIQGGRTVAAQEQSLIATNSFQTTASTVQMAAAETYSLSANQVEQSVQEGIRTRASFAMEQYGSLSPTDQITEAVPAALQDIQSTLDRFSSAEGLINGLIQMIGVNGANVRINRGVDYQTSSVEVQVTEGVTLTSRGGYVEMTAGGITLRGIPGLVIQPPDELILAANEIKEGLEAINALLNISQLTQDLRDCEPQSVIQRRDERKKKRKQCETQRQKGVGLTPECQGVVLDIPPGDRGNNPVTLPSPSSGSTPGGSAGGSGDNPSSSPSEANRNNFPAVSPNVNPLSRLSASVTGSASLGGSIDTWMAIPNPNIEPSIDPTPEPVFELDRDLATQIAQRQNQGDTPLDILPTAPSTFNNIVDIPDVTDVIQLPEGLTIPIVSNQNRIQPAIGPTLTTPTPDFLVSTSDLSSADQRTLIDRLLNNLPLDLTYETLREYIPPEIDLRALVALSEDPQRRNEALIQVRDILSQSVIQRQTQDVLGPEYAVLREPLVDLLRRGVEPEALPGALLQILRSVDPRLGSLDSAAQIALQAINPFNGSLDVNFNGVLGGLLSPNDPLVLAISGAALISQQAVRDEIMKALRDGRTAQDVLLAVMGQLGGPAELVRDVIGRVTDIRDFINSGTIGDLIGQGDFTGLLGQIANLDPTGFLSGTLDTLMPIVDLFQTIVRVPDMLSVLSQSNRPLLQRFTLLLGCLDLIRKIEAVLNLFNRGNTPVRNPLELVQNNPNLALPLIIPQLINLTPVQITQILSGVTGRTNLPPDLVNALDILRRLTPGQRTQILTLVSGTPIIPPDLAPAVSALRPLNPTEVAQVISLVSGGVPVLQEPASPRLAPAILALRPLTSDEITQVLSLVSGAVSIPPELETAVQAVRQINPSELKAIFPLVLNRTSPARVLEFLPLQIQIINSIQRLPVNSIPQARLAEARTVLRPDGVLDSVVVTQPGSGYQPDFNDVEILGSDVRVQVQGGSIQAIEVVRPGQYTSPPQVIINPQPPLPSRVPLPPQVISQIYQVNLMEFSDECFQIPRLTLAESRMDLVRLEQSQVFFSRSNVNVLIPIKGIIQLLIPSYKRMSDGATLYAYQRDQYYTPLLHTATIRDFNLDSNQGLALLDSTLTFYLEDGEQEVSAYTYADFGSQIMPNVALVYLVA